MLGKGGRGNDGGDGAKGERAKDKQNVREKSDQNEMIVTDLRLAYRS